ncbi:MAG: hypothetical protein ABJG78_16245 [Cyclobacteriaceae bacterium]
MQLKALARLFVFLLAVNFAAQLILPTSHMEVVQLEIDSESDSEEKESKNEKETDKLNHGHRLSKLETKCKSSLLAIHYDHWWVPPTIEMSCPPPEIG